MCGLPKPTQTTTTSKERDNTKQNSKMYDDGNNNNKQRRCLQTKVLRILLILLHYTNKTTLKGTADLSSDVTLIYYQLPMTEQHLDPICNFHVPT